MDFQDSESMSLQLAENEITDWPAAILAVGLTTRLRPITEEIPKAFITGAGEPSIAHQLRKTVLRAAEATCD